MREIRIALNIIPKYIESPEYKRAIENEQRVATALENLVIANSSVIDKERIPALQEAET